MKENKEANSNTSNNNIDISNIEYDIQYVLENVAALGKAAYGAYNEKMKELLVLTIKKAVMEERIRVMKEERLKTIDSVIRIFDSARGDMISKQAVISILNELK